MSLFDDVTTGAVERALQGVALRQQTTAENLANSATPGYRAQQVSFESSLAAALQAGQPSAAAITVGDAGTPDNGNGNTVSMEKETNDLLQSGLQYQALVQAMNYKFGVLHDAIGS